MAALLVVNPFASRVDDALVERVRAVLGDVEVARTERPGHATELVRDACGWAEAIYVLSGDGGFNEALNGADGRVPLGFLPGGGANVLPRALGLPRDAVRAAERMRAAVPRRISLGRVDGRRFGFACGVGLDAELVRRVDALGRRPDGRRPGDLAFVWAALRLLAQRRGRLEPTLELEGLGRVAFALVANGDPYTYAGRLPLHAAPLARFEGGLDLVAPRAVTPRSLPRLAAYLLCGDGQQRARDVVYRHDLDRLRIRCDRPTPLQVDGEDLGDVTEALVECERDAVAVLV